MSHEHPYGKSKGVLKFSKDDKVLIEMSPLQKMFEHPEVRNRKIVTFSIIGAYRKGKSFFLDYCLRFMYANYPSINYPNNPVSNPEDWMGDEDEPLQGYSWRSGADRDTMGIVIWNDVFLHTDDVTGEKLAIVIIDTQGLFDNETTTTNNSRIFALGTLISSIQVLNLSNVIQEDQLQYLQFATEFAKFASKNNHGCGDKSFQNLMFLIRDWQNPGEHPFGIEGGNKYLKKMLEIKNSRSKELKSVREFIKNSFDELSCALLPHPGKIVTGGKTSSNEGYKGNWGDMDEDFKEELSKIIPYLLSPERLVIKKVNGMHTTGVEFLEYVEKFFKIFQSDRIPQARAVFEMTVDTHFTSIINSCLDRYSFLIFDKPGNIEKIEDIPFINERIKNEVLLMYKDAKKMGNAEHEAKFRKTLEDQMDKIYNEWKDQTEANIRKIEDEKQKTRMAEKEKQKLAIDKLRLEQEALEHNLKLEKVKQEFEMQKLILTKDKEIDQIKFKAETERQADERRHDIEKFKLQQAKDMEEASKIHEISLLKHEGMQNEVMATSNLEMERIKSEAKKNTAIMQQQFEAAERERNLKEEQLKHAQAMDRERAEKEAEAMRLLHEAQIRSAREEMEWQKELANREHLHQQQLAKERQRREEENLKQIQIQQRLEEERRRNAELQRQRAIDEENKQKGLLRTIGGWLW